MRKLQEFPLFHEHYALTFNRLDRNAGGNCGSLFLPTFYNNTEGNPEYQRPSLFHYDYYASGRDSPSFLARSLLKAGRTYFNLLTPTSDKLIDRTETDSVMQKASVPSSTAPADSSGVPLSTTTLPSSLHSENKYHPPQRQARSRNCKEKRRPPYLISQ